MRRHDWPERLHEVIAKAKKEAFAWGTHDCALFACNCAHAMTGIDYAANFRGKYKTRKGALTALVRIEGVKTLPELADKYLGERIALVNTQRGDVVLLTADSVEALGVVVGKHAVFLAPDGIQTLLLEECICAWRVK